MFKREPIAKLPFREEPLSSMLMGRVEKEIDNSRSDMSRVKRVELIGLGPGAKLRISVPGIDSEHRIWRSAWGEVGEKGWEKRSHPLQ